MERRKEQEQGAAILQQQLLERQAQRIREEELREQVRSTQDGTGHQLAWMRRGSPHQLTRDTAATAGR